MKSMTCRLVLAALLLAAQAGADTAGDIVASVYDKGLYFDADRFDTATLLGFIDDGVSIIGTVGQTNEAQTAIVLGSGYRYALPSDFFVATMAVLNADLAQTTGLPQPSMLPQVSPAEYTEHWSPSTGRPRHFMVWNDSVWFDLASYTQADTVTLLYYALPGAIDAVGDTIDLPAEFVPLLKDVVVQMCLWRIEYPDKSPEDRALSLTALIREALEKRATE